MFRCQLLRLLLLLLSSRWALALQHVRWEQGSVVLAKGHQASASIWQGASKLNLMGALQDNPPGSFRELMGPVSQAVGLSYNATLGPDYNATYTNLTIDAAHAAGETWDRLYGLEVSPPAGGVHALVFASHSAQRAIVAFRGMCLNNTDPQCMADLCFGLEIQGWGSSSEMMYGVTKAECKKVKGLLDYDSQADAVVKKVQAAYPSYKVLLAGHSLGGFLAITTAARQPGVLQAITFAPTPFHYALTNLFGFSGADVAALPEQDLVSTCDKYDCGYNSVHVKNAREGGTTCLYLDVQEPVLCSMTKVDPYNSTGWRSALKSSSMAGLCKASAHQWSRYESVVWQTEADGVTPAHLPSCSQGYSNLVAEGDQLAPQPSMDEAPL